MALEADASRLKHCARGAMLAAAKGAQAPVCVGGRCMGDVFGYHCDEY